MTKNIYIVPIEPIDTRYTRQWYEHIPTTLESVATQFDKNIDIIIIDGDQVPPVPSPGAFLDFGATNIYKSSQLGIISELFQHGKVKPGDKFLFTDAWNPSVISVKYMSELLKIPVELHGMWHAGSYDPQDFLGRLIGKADWVRHAEKGMFHCYNTNWFATNFHIDMFINEMLGPFTINNFLWSDKTVHISDIKNQLMSKSKIGLTGWPMDYLIDQLAPYASLPKKNKIVFPHRLAPEKQLYIFNDLAKELHEYEWVICQQSKLSKDEYHRILGESKITFSANLQETFGISMIEGLLCNSFPLVPDRLSYSEMYSTEFKYPSLWTENQNEYFTYRDRLISRIRLIMESYESNKTFINDSMQLQRDKLSQYIHATSLIASLLT